MKPPSVLLYMATTTAAYGKVQLAAQRGEMMPEGWMIDALGQDLCKPGGASGRRRMDQATASCKAG